MEKSQQSKAATESLEALERELASASGNVTKELSLLTSVIDQCRENDMKDPESPVQETTSASEQSEASGTDFEEETETSQVEPTPADVDSSEIQLEKRKEYRRIQMDMRKEYEHRRQRMSHTDDSVKAQWTQHDQQRENHHPSPVISSLQALFFFSFIGPGLLVLYLIATLFTTDPFPF